MNELRLDLKPKKTERQLKVFAKKKWCCSVFFIAFVLILVATGCRTVPETEIQKDPGTPITRLLHTELANGIPVVMQRTPGDKVCSVNLVIEGGSSLVPVHLSGIESITLEGLLLGSKNFSYEAIQQKENDDYAALSSTATRDYSVYTLSCSLSGLEDIFAVYADCFIHPLFDKNDFDALMTRTAQEFHKTQETPEGLLLSAAEAAVYAKHPYECTTSVTSDSLDTITLNLVKKQHDRMMNAARLRFVIAGDFDSRAADDLVEKMNQTFGLLPRTDFIPPAIPEIVSGGEPVYVESETAGDSGYILGCFTAPSAGDADYVPYAIGTQILTGILFEKLVKEDKTAESAGTGIIPGKKMVGVISIYKTSRIDKDTITDVLSLFPSETQLEKQLDGYKNEYLNTLFSQSATVSGKADRMIRFLEYTGDAENCFLRQKQVLQVTAQQVVAAYTKYILGGSVRWIVVASKNSADRFGFSEDDK